MHYIHLGANYIKTEQVHTRVIVTALVYTFLILKTTLKSVIIELNTVLLLKEIRL